MLLVSTWEMSAAGGSVENGTESHQREVEISC